MKTTLRMKTTLLLLTLAAATTAAKFVPGVVPNTYQDGDALPLQVDLLTSLSSRVPFSYHSLGYCSSKEGSKKDNKKQGTFGDKLAGGDMKESGYTVRVKENVVCESLCYLQLKDRDIRKFRKMIRDDYRNNMYLDNLPSVMHSSDLDWVMRGFPVGFLMQSNSKSSSSSSSSSTTFNDFYLYNHIRIVISYHDDATQFTGSRIVGLEIIPYSIDHQFDGDGAPPALHPSGFLAADAPAPSLKTCSPTNPAVNDPASYLKLSSSSDTKDTKVLYTYDVDWVYSDSVWSDRWDIYLSGNPDDEVHIFSLVNSVMVILFLSGIVAMILLRTLNKEISEYNELSTLEEAQEESGWKLVHSDVFRSPQSHRTLLAVCVGTGVQIGVAIFLVMCCAVAGAMSPTDKGQSLTTIILLYVFCGSFAGYHSARLYKLFGGKNWKRNTIGTAIAFPGAILTLFFVLDVGLLYEGAATAVSFTTVLTIFLLWVGVSTPLVFVGSYFGFRKEVLETPLKATMIARHIPETSNMNMALGVILGGLLPFGSVCIELFFIMSSLWLSQIYYVFGFLFAVLMILTLTCAEISIVMCYFQLCNEDYRWWWRSFLNTASTGGYLFAYSIWYYVTKLQLEGFLSAMVFFTYNLMISLAFGLFTGAIGFFAAFIFIKRIYAAIKVD